MPAKRRDEPRYKPFIGRIFSLRKHKKIPAYFTHNGTKMLYTLDKFGEAVLVLDETNTRARVVILGGGAVWIPKFFLHKEIKNGEFQKADTISELIQETLNVAEDLRKQGHEHTAALYRIAHSLRQYVDKIIPTNFEE